MGARDGDGARRAYTGLYRGTFVSADDSRKLQEITIRGRFGEEISGVEHWQPFGISTVPLAPEGNQQAEALIANIGGSADHPVVLGVADRRHRPKNAKPGETILYDHQGQQIKLGNDGIDLAGGEQKKPFKVVVGNASLAVTDGQIVAQVGGQIFTILPNRVNIGTGSKAVKLSDNSNSTNLFAD